MWKMTPSYLEKLLAISMGLICVWFFLPLLFGFLLKYGHLTVQGPLVVHIWFISSLLIAAFIVGIGIAIAWPIFSRLYVSIPGTIIIAILIPFSVIISDAQASQALLQIFGFNAKHLPETQAMLGFVFTIVNWVNGIAEVLKYVSIACGIAIVILTITAFFMKKAVIEINQLLCKIILIGLAAIFADIILWVNISPPLMMYPLYVNKIQSFAATYDGYQQITLLSLPCQEASNYDAFKKLSRTEVSVYSYDVSKGKYMFKILKCSSS